MPPEGKQILDFAKSIAFDQGRIVGRVVRHHERRRTVESVDQQTALVIQRGVDGAAHVLNIAFSEPPTDRIEQTVGDGLVVLTFKEPKEAPLLVVTAIVLVVDNRQYPPARLAIPQSQERLPLVFVIEWMIGKPDELFLVHPQRGHPVGIAALNLPRQMQKLPFFRPVAYRNNRQICHGKEFRFMVMTCLGIPSARTLGSIAERSRGSSQ